jgi:uncharacterized protein (TIGR02271 family)
MTNKPTPAPGESDPQRLAELTRSEEELQVGTEAHDIGAVRVRKHPETERVSDVVPRAIEHADVERVDANDVDSGEIETLPDGSVSIPVFEEQLVVEKRLVVRERIIIRKHTVTEEQRIEADLRRERIEVDVDDTVRDRVHRDQR